MRSTFFHLSCVLPLLTLITIHGVAAQGFYQVIGSRTLRPNSEYRAAVTVRGASTPSAVDVAVIGRSYGGKVFKQSATVDVRPYSSTIVGLQIGDLDPGEYRLTAKGTGGLTFEDVATLRYAAKTYAVFVQTDKGVYRPGDTVRFRAIALNSQLKPGAELRSVPLNVHVTDGAGNKVKEWRAASTTRGVFADELRLSENPILGDWHLSVVLNGQHYNRSFAVAEYVSPKFLVTVQAPRHVTFDENVIAVNVQAVYDYGKKVKGDATVTVYPTINSGVIQPIFQNPLRKVVAIDGSASVNFDVEHELRLNEEYERTVIVDVRVEEALTGRRQNNSVEMQLHKYAYKIELIKTADYYKPGLKYTAYVRVTNHDGGPLKNDRTVKIRHGYSRTDEIYAEETRRVDKNGLIALELYPPRNSTNETALRIEAEYLDLKERMPPVPAAVSRSNNFLLASIATDNPRVNLDVEIVVNCTEPMKYVSYVVMGRGDVLIARTLPANEKNVLNFRFTATHAMVPLAHLIVSYIRDTGELVADSVDVEVDGLMQNFIDIELSATETEPGSDVDITVRSQSNSYVGLMAVDQSVAALKSGYDLTSSYVEKQLIGYDVAPASPYRTIAKDPQRRHFFWKQGASNAKDVYQDSGSVLMTNGIVSSRRPTLEDIYLRPVSYETKTVKPDRGVGLSFAAPTRPPLAGPYAFSRIPRPVWDKPKVYLTEHVADTWLFMNFSSGNDGRTSIRRKLPDTLNTWLVSGFSLDPLFGLGVTGAPKKLKVSKPFVVNFDLPPSIKLGEILSIPVVVYNELGDDVLAEVTLHNQEQAFGYVDVADNESSANATRKVELYRRKKLTVKKYGQASTSFMVTPHRTGDVEIKVTASGRSRTDSANKILKVVPEGEVQYYSKTILIDLRNIGSFKGNVTYELPHNIVPDSQTIEASVVGDLLGPTVINLDRLIRLPTGCGEQNLVNFLPNVIVLDYLSNSGQLSPYTSKEAIANLEIGYQEQLTYRRGDGSFSPFGKMDANGSVWLTAYTAMAFAQAKPYIYVDDAIVSDAFKWLADRQSVNGGFLETGTIVHEHLQNGDDRNLALTAFVVVSFIENKRTTSTYQNVISKGLDFIARNINDDDDVYALAICSYALQLARHVSKRNAYNLLETRAKSERNMKWWSRDVPQSESNSPWSKLPRTVDIEMTSYALLTLLDANLVEDALPVVNWLTGQSNNIGGFTSSQDTVVGLLALSKLIPKLATITNMQIEFSARKQETNAISINKNTAMIVQKLQLPKDTKVVNVSATGSGIALFRVAYRFHVNVTGPWPMFTLDPQVDKNSDGNHLQLSICTAFVSKNLSETARSNMAVMEVNFPSGYTADVDSLPSLEVSQNVRKVQTKNKDTVLLLYFDHLTTTEYCPTVSAYRTHKVAKLRPAHVVVYDYYDSSRRARVFYRGRKVTSCNICEGEDCGNCVSEPDPQVAGESKEGGSGVARMENSRLLLVLATLVTSRVCLSSIN